MAELLRPSPNINQQPEGHLKGLCSQATIKRYLIVQTEERNRRIRRAVDHYNLDVVAVGYRVKSPRGTRFTSGQPERLRISHQGVHSRRRAVLSSGRGRQLLRGIAGPYPRHPLFERVFSAEVLTSTHPHRLRPQRREASQTLFRDRADNMHSRQLTATRPPTERYVARTVGLTSWADNRKTDSQHCEELPQSRGN